MSKLKLNAVGFINKVTELKGGKVALELALNSYSVPKKDEEGFDTKRLYVTAYTNDEKLVPEDYENKPFNIEVSGLVSNPKVHDGKAYANLTCSFESATLVEKKQAEAS